MRIYKQVRSVYYRRNKEAITQGGCDEFCNIPGHEWSLKHRENGHIGVDDTKVKILAGVMQKYGGEDIILKSDWKKVRIMA